MNGLPGLDQMLTSAVADIVGPLKLLLSTLCYIMGLGFAFNGLIQLKKRTEMGARGPEPRAIMMSFVLVGVFMSVGNMMDAIATTVFGSTGSSASVTLAYSAGDNNGLTQQANNMINALLSFSELIGWMAFVRGWLLLNSYANGRTPSQAGAWVHIAGGVIAVHGNDMIAAIQGTLGINLVN